MRYRIFILVNLFIACIYSQVGINTVNPQASALHIDAAGNNPSTGSPNIDQASDDVFINTLGNIGLGHINPAYKLHIKTNGNDKSALKIEDGLQGSAKVLRSDALGYGYWRYPGELLIVRGKLGNGITPKVGDYPNPDKIVNAGATIALPPGRWLVTVSMKLESSSDQSSGNPVLRMWIRSTFTDTPEAQKASEDIVGAIYISGLGYQVGAGKLEGYIVIDNATNETKTYYYGLAYSHLYQMPQDTKLIDFAGSRYAENRIIAVKMKNL